jgi:hypothetical protein
MVFVPPDLLDNSPLPRRISARILRGKRSHIMRPWLTILFVAVPLSIIASLVVASRDRSIMNVGAVLWSDPWFHATLLDAYAGFITFYVWVAYKERPIAAKILWFALIMGLGNIATAAYVLLQLARMKPGDSWESLLLRRNATAGASPVG